MSDWTRDPNLKGVHRYLQVGDRWVYDTFIPAEPMNQTDWNTCHECGVSQPPIGRHHEVWLYYCPDCDQGWAVATLAGGDRVRIYTGSEPPYVEVER